MSKATARPCNIEWIRAIIAQCKAAGVACFVSQLGAKPYDMSRMPHKDKVFTADELKIDEHLETAARMVAENCAASCIALKSSKGGDPSEWPEDLRVREFPKVTA